VNDSPSISGRAYSATYNASRLHFTTRVATAESIYCIQYDAPAVQWLTNIRHHPSHYIRGDAARDDLCHGTSRLALAFVATSIVPFLMIIPEVYDRRNARAVYQREGAGKFDIGDVQEVLSALRVVKPLGVKSMSRSVLSAYRVLVWGHGFGWPLSRAL